MRKDMRLKDFKADEHILVVVRKHWFVFVKTILGLLILFLIPFFFIPFLTIFVAEGGGPVTINAGYGVFFASFWALVLWQMLFAKWTDYYYDVWIVTNWRIIDIDQQGFFNRDIATLLNLDHIEDIKTYVDSVIGTFLNYGCIQVQTAAAQREFIIRNIANPREVERIIRKAQEVRLGLKPGKGHE